MSLSLLACLCSAQVRYTVTYLDSTRPMVDVRIDVGQPIRPGSAFIMPRSIPGTYTIANYDQFIVDPIGMDAEGRTFPLSKLTNGAPRWVCADSQARISVVQYQVDIARMEAANQPSDASLLRPGFAGLLLYSVLGWVEGFDSLPIRFSVRTFTGWPAFCTLEPSDHPTRGSLSLDVADYPTLADAQLYLGPAFRVKRFGGEVPFYVAAFGQSGTEDLDNYGWMGVSCMRLLKDYFGMLPFQHYTLVVSKALQPGNREAPAFAMEHLASSTFLGDTSGMLMQRLDTIALRHRMPTYLHHMAHAFLPMRCYAGRYRPRPLEIPPLVETIWMNEGFMWFLVYDILKMPRLAERFRTTVAQLPVELRSLTLQEHSYQASTMYSLDFRTGMGIYARGAMMAMEMDQHIRASTGGTRGMRDVLRYLYGYVQSYPLPIAPEALPGLMKEAVGVDLEAIFRRWSQPLMPH